MSVSWIDETPALDGRHSNFVLQERSVLSLNFSNLKSSHASLVLQIDEAHKSTCVTDRTRNRFR